MTDLAVLITRAGQGQADVPPDPPRPPQPVPDLPAAILVGRPRRLGGWSYHPGMDESETGATWDCQAYGAEGTAIGALCFQSPELGERVCLTKDECHDLLASERLRVHGRINEMAAAGDPTGQHLAAVFTSPDQLLGGGGGAGHAFVPGDADSTFGDAGTWCAVWVTSPGESDHCGLPPEAHGPAESDR